MQRIKMAANRPSQLRVLLLLAISLLAGMVVSSNFGNRTHQPASQPILLTDNTRP